MADVERRQEIVPGGGKAALTGEASAAGSAARLDQLLGYHLRRASLVDTAGFNAAFGEEPVRQVPFSVLCRIGEAPGITAAAICRDLGLKRANIVAILAEFDAAGLISREADPGDQRVQSLSLTAEGTVALARWRAAVAGHEAAMLSRLSTAERETLARLLEKIWRAAG